MRQQDYLEVFDDLEPHNYGINNFQSLDNLLNYHIDPTFVFTDGSKCELQEVQFEYKFNKKAPILEVRLSWTVKNEAGRLQTVQIYF